MSKTKEANRVIKRLDQLSEGIANGRAYCDLVQTLESRKQSLEGDQADAVHIARAAMLRAAIGCVMAALDVADDRDNRASIGQILNALKDKGVLALLASRRRHKANTSVALNDIRKSYHELCASSAAKKCRRLRNQAVAHFLLDDAEPVEPTTHDEVFALQNSAEELAEALFTICAAPIRFRDHAQTTRARAELFWDMVYRGGAVLR